MIILKQKILWELAISGVTSLSNVAVEIMKEKKDK
jgi:hypothetical protein